MNGVEMKKIYDATRSLMFDTVEMLRALERDMRGFEQKVQNKRMTTYDIGSAAELMPYFLELIFTKSDADAKRGIGVGVLFDDLDRRQLEFPIVFAGVLECPQQFSKNFSYNLYHLCRLKADKMKLTADPPFYRATFTGTRDCTEGTGYFLRLEALENRQELKRLIIDPCISLFDGKAQVARASVAKVALNATDFFPNGI